MNSFFSCTSSACDLAIISSVYASLSLATVSSHRNRFRFVALRAREKQRQHPVVAFGRDPVHIDFDGNGDRSVEAAGPALAAMQGGVVAILDRFGSGDPDCVVLDLDLKIRFANAGHFDDDHDVVALAKDIERRIGAAAAQARTWPTAGSVRIKRLLKLEQGVERIRQHCHNKPPAVVLPNKDHRRVGRIDVSQSALLPAHGSRSRWWSRQGRRENNLAARAGRFWGPIKGRDGLVVSVARHRPGSMGEPAPPCPRAWLSVISPRVRLLKPQDHCEPRRRTNPYGSADRRRYQRHVWMLT